MSEVTMKQSFTETNFKMNKQMNAWSDLPNAKHIDAILASVKAHPKKWAEAWIKSDGWTNARTDSRERSSRSAWVAWNTARDAAGTARNVAGTAWNAVCEAQSAVGGATYDSVNNVTRVAARNAAWDAILALLAYDDDCAHLLHTNPEHVKMLAGIGNEAAILLYPASLFFGDEE